MEHIPRFIQVVIILIALLAMWAIDQRELELSFGCSLMIVVLLLIQAVIEHELTTKGRS